MGPQILTPCPFCETARCHTNRNHRPERESHHRQFLRQTPPAQAFSARPAPLLLVALIPSCWCRYRRWWTIPTTWLVSTFWPMVDSTPFSGSTTRDPLGPHAQSGHRSAPAALVDRRVYRNSREAVSRCRFLHSWQAARWPCIWPFIDGGRRGHSWRSSFSITVCSVGIPELLVRSRLGPVCLRPLDRVTRSFPHLLVPLFSVIAVLLFFAHLFAFGVFALVVLS